MDYNEEIARLRSEISVLKHKTDIKSRMMELFRRLEHGVPHLEEEEVKLIQDIKIKENI